MHKFGDYLHYNRQVTKNLSSTCIMLHILARLFFFSFFFFNTSYRETIHIYIKELSDMLNKLKKL